jgi:hypothetical protein
MIKKIKLILKNLKFLYKFDVEKVLRDVEIYISHTTNNRMSRIYDLEVMIQEFDTIQDMEITRILEEYKCLN